MKASNSLIFAVEQRMRSVPVENVRAHAATIAAEPKYQPGGSGNLAKRVRWDLFWATCPTAFRDTLPELKALTDAHLDTVLRKVMAGLAPEFATP